MKRMCLNGFDIVDLLTIIMQRFKNTAKPLWDKQGKIFRADLR